jgi:hypothetical protein
LKTVKVRYVTLLQDDPLHLIERKFIPSAIIKLGCSRRGMVCHGSGVLEYTSVVEISSDTCGAKM